MNLINFLANSVNCGGVIVDGIIVAILRIVYNGLIIVVPLVLVIVGIVALIKRKGKGGGQIFLKQIIIAVIVVALLLLIKYGVSGMASRDTNQDNLNWQCVDTIINGKD